MVKFADGPSGDDMAGGLAALPKTKSFASKSLGESEKSGIQVTLYQLRYKVPNMTNKKEWKYLLGGLEPLSGTLDPGNMIALMGSSGAGKSTLMDVISKRKTVGIIEGHVLFDGHTPSKAEASRDTGYVEQRDSLWGFFTVTEMLTYTACLKMPPKYSFSQKTGRVDEVITQMGLTKARATKIGGAMVRGVSGGEAKRISIAIGLLNNPRIMFFDEPTSGLDSAISLDVMGTIKELAVEGRTVLVTIHQPSGRLFELFDQIVLLSRDQETKSGNVVYMGETGNGACELRDYFVKMGYPFDAEIYDNVPEYVLEIISGGVSGPKSEGDSLITSYHDSELCDENERIAEGIAATVGENNKEQKLTGKPVYANNTFTEIAVLLAYKGRAQWKDHFFILSRVGLWLTASLLVDTLYAGQTMSFDGLTVVVSIIFIVIFLTAIITIIYVPGLITDKPVFLRESADAMYRPLSYSMANFITEASAVVISTILFVSTLYWAIRGPMNPSVGAFFFFMLTHFLYSMTACAVTLALASPLPTIELCIGAVAVFALLNVAVMGFLAPVPVWWGWMGLISYMRWAFGAFMINQFATLNVNICEDQPPNTMVNWTALANADLDNIGVTMNDIGGLLCSSIEALDTLQNNDLNDLILGNTTTGFPGVCPDSPALGSALNLVTQPGSTLTANCAPIWDDFASGALQDAITFAPEDIARNFLSRYPLGDNYDAKRKFTEFSKWECLGYLLIIFFAFLVLYWQTCKLSIKLVKR
jgi:ABC-type multidrug transport system ATPase subunit